MVTKDCPCQSRTTHLPQQACLCCCYMSGDFLIRAAIALPAPLAGGTWGSCLASVWCTWPTGSRNLEMDAPLVGPCPRGSLGETLQVTPLVPLPTKLSSPWDRFVRSSLMDVKTAIFRPPGEQEASRRCDGASGLSGRHWAERSHPRCLTGVTQGRGFAALPHRAPAPRFCCGTLSTPPFPIRKPEFREKVS